MNQISVMVVDSQALSRELLAHLMMREPDFRVLPSASASREAIPTAFERKPDVVLMDVDMSGMICFDAAKQIMLLCPKTRIIFMAAAMRQADIRRMLEIKAHGFVLKTQTPAQLFEAIRKVAGRGSYYSSEVAACVAAIEQSRDREEPAPASRWLTLTRRERDVLQYLARGLSKKEIATLVQVSIKTVEGHVQNVMNKLDIHNRVSLTRYAIREGLMHA